MAPLDAVAVMGDGRAAGVSEYVGLPGRPVIVGGCPRSGTTLLRTMLHAHPELALPKETRFVLECWRRRRAFGDLNDEENRRAVARWIFMRKESQAGRLGLEPEVAVERLAAAPPTLGSLLAECFAMFAEKHGKPRWGDKRPSYASRIEAIFDLFPSAQFVNVVRDPRACIASMRKLDWFDGIAASVELWERSLAAVDAVRERLAGDELLDVRYEELVLEPARTLERVADFVGASSDEDDVGQMMRYYEVREKRSRRYHANLERPLDASRISGWAEFLSPKEIAFVEQATSPLMGRWGYERTAAGIPVPAELWNQLAAKRKEQQAAHRRLLWRERLRKHLVYRHPLAARPRGATDAAAEPAHS